MSRKNREKYGQHGKNHGGNGKGVKKRTKSKLILTNSPSQQ
jgi:hypothetical protein